MPSQADFAQSHLQFHSDLSHGCTHPTAEPEAPKDHPGSTLHQDWACPHYHSSSPCLALEAVHSYSTHSQDHYPSLEKGELLQKNSQLNKMTTKGSAASAPVATLTLEQRMPLDPEVRRRAPARGSVALDKGGSGENEGEAHVSAVCRKCRLLCRSRASVRPGSSLCTPARLRDCTSLGDPGAPTPPPRPSQADLGRRGRPVAAVVAAVRAGSSGPKHFTIVLQNC